MSRSFRAWRLVAPLLVCAPVLAAQGVVSGQVSIRERPGEETEDLTNAVVWLEATTPSRAHPATTATSMQLQSRQFQPRVKVVTEGSKVTFLNGDSFSHNVFSKAAGSAFDTGVFGRSEKHVQLFKDAGVVPLYCNIHPRMTGYVVVLPSANYAQAGDDGRFRLSAVPAGSYVLHVWHDRATEATRPLVVAAAGVAVPRVELDGRGYRFVQHKNKFGQEYTSATGDRY